MSNKHKNVERMVEWSADRLIAWRKPLLALFLLITVAFGYSATGIRLDPGFNKQIPVNHPFMQNLLHYSDTFSGANNVLVSVRWKGEGDIYNPEFLSALRQVTDEVFFIPGVRRASVSSLFTPNTRYIEVTEQGYIGDVVVPPHFNGSEEDLQQVRRNTERSGQIGQLVANDLSAAMVRADLQEINPQTGDKVSYVAISRQLEDIRKTFENDNIGIDIVGFSKLTGDVVAGLIDVMWFFLIAFVITTLLLWLYCRSVKLTVVSLLVAMLPVVWLLGLLRIMGMGIDPMSILVPFLIFSIGVSHAVQMTNAWKQDVLGGKTSMEAAHSAFCKIFVPGALALLMNALGFGVIMLIDIPIVHELGVTACLGVLLMIITNKMMLPIIISHLQLERAAESINVVPDGRRHKVWWPLSRVAEPRTGLVVFAVSLLLLVGGAWKSRDLIVGDVSAGAPELRAESRYNQDNASIVERYSIGLDLLTVYVENQVGDGDACLDPDVMRAVEKLDFHTRSIPGVQSVASVAGMGKVTIAGNNEGNPRWAAIPGSERGLQAGSQAYSDEHGLVVEGCETMQVVVYLSSHEGTQVERTINRIEEIIASIDEPKVEFKLAGGNVGVQAASNEAVKKAEVQMHGALLASVALFCWLTFRSFRAVLCIIMPLAIVATLCNALMASLGIGLKVATLPVLALGVGVGVDYGIYIYERLQHELSLGKDFREAFYEAMVQRGTASLFTAVTMSIGVGTWAFAPLKFQADMGILLAFMFLVNVFGAIFLLPALAAWFNRAKRLVRVERVKGAEMAVSEAAG
ncbi:efflux RND transporter permease subunit [Marinobacter sp. X15-166B]|uniref:efflux RND transporter permease subunit n=1 Tax=Marinobacter sp. X15-166B TaxID=1897620 RepID=UPI00085BD906|nr:efflux RND transporter permease subunit [Marinobacter sp. X15-166B]OEY66330.1 transporter [Marinobacter sp. X15-166B]